MAMAIEIAHGEVKLTASEFDRDREMEVMIENVRLHEENAFQIYISPNEANMIVVHMIKELRRIGEFDIYTTLKESEI